MKACWDPKFEPSVYRRDRGLSIYGNSLGLLSLASSYSGAIFTQAWLSKNFNNQNLIFAIYSFHYIPSSNLLFCGYEVIMI